MEAGCSPGAKGILLWIWDGGAFPFSPKNTTNATKAH